MNKQYQYFTLELEDGQILTTDLVIKIGSYLLSTTNKLFIKENYWKINFVGYVELLIDETIYQIFSYPKHYPKTKITQKQDFQLILKSIMKSNNHFIGLENQDNLEIDASLLYLNNIVNYYLKFGLYKETVKSYNKGYAKNVNFNKTINKVLPRYQEGNFIYDQYVNNQKIDKYTILTECLVHFINVETKKYQFYFPQYQIDFEYNEEKYSDISYLRTQLHRIYDVTFDDQTKYLIENMLNYLNHEQKAVNKELLLCTTNYELVWEKMVACLLGADYRKQDFTVTDDGHKISIDHFSRLKRTIFDAKYYKTNHNLKRKIDYKQLFYHYHVVHEEKNVLGINEYLRWTNALIKPIESDNQVKKYITRNKYDQVNIDEYFINTKETINYYVNGGVNPLATLLKNL